MDTPAPGRKNSSLILNRRGGSKYTPQGSDDHRVIPPKNVEEEARPPPNLATHHVAHTRLNRAIVELCEDLEHERNRRYGRIDFVRMHRKNYGTGCAKDRAEYAVAQLQVNRDLRSLVEELVIARR